MSRLAKISLFIYSLKGEVDFIIFQVQDVQSCLKAVVMVMHEVTYVAGLRPALGVVSEFAGKWYCSPGQMSQW